MQKIKRSLLTSLCLGLGTLMITGCAARGGAGAKRAEAVLESKQNATVAGVVTLEDHYGGVLAYGKLTGIRSDRDYRVQIHEKGDCSARNASSAGNMVATVSKSGNSMVGKDGKVMGDLGKKMGIDSLVGKSVVVMSVDSANSKEFRVACGVLKSKASMGKSCTDCKGDCKDCKGDCKECKDGKSCKCGKDGKCMGDCKCGKDCKCGADCKCPKMKHKQKAEVHSPAREANRRAPASVY